MHGQSFSINKRQYTLTFTTNALCAFEDVSGVPIIQVADADQMGATRLRQLVWAGLSHEKLSLDEAGEIIDALGFEKASKLVGNAMEKAFPAAQGKSQASPEAG